MGQATGPTFTLGELAAKLDAALDGAPDLQLRGIAALETAQPDQLSFLANARYQHLLKTTRAGALIVSSDETEVGRPALRVANPYYTFARALELFHPAPVRPMLGVAPGATVSPEAALGPEVNVWPGAWVGAGARIGAGCDIRSGAYVDAGVSMGEGCVVHPNAVLYAGTELGDRVVVHSGAIIAADGFGYATSPQGHYKVPQVGRVVIGDDVEIGANTTIDRATLGATRIGRGTKIDNLVQLAHNVQIGEHCLIVSQVGVSGSTRLGDRVVLAGQVGLVGHIELGSDVIVGAQSGVSRDIKEAGVYLGAPAVLADKAKKQYALISRLPRMREQLQEARQRIQDLEARLERLEQEH